MPREEAGRLGGRACVPAPLLRAAGPARLHPPDGDDAPELGRGKFRGAPGIVQYVRQRRGRPVPARYRLRLLRRVAVRGVVPSAARSLEADPLVRSSPPPPRKVGMTGATTRRIP